MTLRDDIDKIVEILDEIEKMSTGKINTGNDARSNIIDTDNNRSNQLAICNQVLRRSDSCLGEKDSLFNNMSLQKNKSIQMKQENRNTRAEEKVSWVEDFVDLSEFCRQTTACVKMEGADVPNNSPISSTVHEDRFVDRIVDLEDEFSVIEEGNNSWYFPPSSQQLKDQELCHPISDWFTTANMNTSNVNIINSPGCVQPNKTNFSISTSAGDNNLQSHVDQLDSFLTPDSSDFTFKEAQQSLILDCPKMPMNFDNNQFPQSTVQSPSITQSHVNQNKMPNLVTRRNSKLELKFDNSAYPFSQITTPEVLKPLEDKNMEFDLVSYVFEGNKAFNKSSIDEYCEDIEEGEAQSSTELGTQSIFGIPIIKEEPQDEIIEPSNDFPISDGRKRKISISESSVSGSPQSNYSSKRRLSTDTIAQYDSGKYRELRDRNNEASRRSRANRKTREVELHREAEELETENRSLKLKAEELEELVKRMRDCLMKMVLKSSG